ncbi:MAG: tRNA pseudouridine(38-40) synthase TruA [Bilifractor sp.]
MKRVMLKVAYDGTNYCGWQVQPNGISVQQVLNDALSVLTGEKIHTIGASRTDAGVHARGNVAVFDTNARMPGDKYAYALNTRLPEDIRVQGSREVPCTFHPRFTSTIKTYEYKILNRRFPDPTRRLDSYFCYVPLDTRRMNQAAKYLIGTHDFRSFRASGETNPDRSTVRTIYSAEVRRSDDLIRFRICGNGFLYNMVRILAGTLIEIGRGRYGPEKMQDILHARDRGAAGPTAPAHGLTLLEIRYPQWEPDFTEEVSEKVLDTDISVI